MSLGRGQMLQSVRRKIEHDLEGRITQYNMADYTNESIEKFCRKLADSGVEDYCKSAVGHSSGGTGDSNEKKTVRSQFADAIAEQLEASSGAESMFSDAEESESSFYSLRSGTNEMESSLVKNLSFSSGGSNWRTSQSPKCSPNKQPVSRLAAKWPAYPTEPEPETEKDFPAPTMGRGKSLQQVSATSALLIKRNPESEIMMACDPSYTNERIEGFIEKMIQKTESGE